MLVSLRTLLISLVAVVAVACASGPGTCADSGSCAATGCKSNGDCGSDPSRPVCDAQSGACRGCARHAECPVTQVCRYEADLPDGVAVGQCYPAAQVAIVDGGRCQPGATGSPGSPYCEVQDAVAAGKKLIAVRAREHSLPYQPIAVTSGQVTILGPWREAEPQAVIGGAQVSGAMTQLVLADLTVSTTGPDFALSCSAASVTLQRATVEYSAQGISGTDGCHLVVDRSKLSNIGRTVLQTTPTTHHVVLNSLIVENGKGFTAQEKAAGTDLALDLGSNLADNVFTFNTLVGNEGAVSCRPGLVLTNSIVASDATPFRNDNCAQDHLFIGSLSAPKVDARYALTPGSDCCIDKAKPDPTVTWDYDNTHRPLGAGYDIGCFEVQ